MDKDIGPSEINQALLDAQAILKAYPGYIFWKDRDSRYLGCNLAFAQLVGLAAPAEIVGLSDYDLPWQIPGQRANFFQAGDQLVLTGESIDNQLETLILPQSPPYLMEVSKRPLRKADGGIYGVLGIAREKSIDANLVAHLEEKLSNMADAQKSQQSFIQNVSHSLRTPLAGILSLVDACMSCTTPENDTLHLIKESSQQLLYHINQLIALADTHKKKKLSIEKAQLCQPAGIFEQLLDIMQPLARKKKLSLEMQGLTALPFQLIFASHTFLSIAIHLVSNAIQLTEKGGITVFCKLVKQHLILSVKDTGCGLSPEEQEQIDQPFTVVTPAYHRATGGLGLGLTLVQYALRDQGGKLFIESTQGQGSCLTVYYPVTIPSTQDRLPKENVLKRKSLNQVSTTVQRKEIPLRQPASTLSPCQLLIIEDNVIAANAVMHLFRSQGDVNVQIVKTAEEGLEFLEKYTFDFILVDIGLPGMSGLEFAQIVSQYPDSPPMVTLSAHVQKAMEEECFAAGMQAVYQKPMKSLEAVALLKKYSPHAIHTLITKTCKEENKS